MEKIHVFTSITANYIPKARVLANSLKYFHPEYQFHLVLCDDRPSGDWCQDGLFDSFISIQDLKIPNPESWLFKHNVVELCTAVKGLAFQKIFEMYQPDCVFYFDPDMAIFSNLKNLIEHMSGTSILLTPHISQPEDDYQAILDNEICSLRHGIFNLGFLGVRPTQIGMDFTAWWSRRLLDFCYDQKEIGLFTDQKWADFIPAFFEDYKVLREPVFNVATWNLTHRKVTGTLPEGIWVNGKPLCFYHFSGFDSGAQEIMLKRYGSDRPVLFELRNWYINECEKMGQSQFGSIPCIYSKFSNNVSITQHHRLVYRNSDDLSQRFPNPFDTSDEDCSFLSWYERTQKEVLDIKHKAAISISEIRGARSWRLINKIRSLRGLKPFDLESVEKAL